MRCFTMSVALLLALLAFGTAQTLGKDPGENKGKGQSFGQQSSGQQNFVKQGNNQNFSGNAGINPGSGNNQGKSGNSAMQMQHLYNANNKPPFAGDNKESHEDWRYRWDNGRWWFWGPGNRWSWWNSGRWYNYYYTGQPVLENFSGGPIKIVNPAKSGVTLNYLLNGAAYSIPPGYSQDLQEDRAWVIQFSRGPNLDQARYGLQTGVYTFARTDHGWELYRSDFPQATAPSPPTAAPTNPPAIPVNPPTAPVNPPSQ